MFSKVSHIFSYLKPYKTKANEDEFINLNKLNWKDEVEPNGFCLIEGHITCPASIVDKSRIAKAIQESTGAVPVVYLRGFYPKANDVSAIYNSFKINNFYMWWKGFLKPKVFFPAFWETIKLIFKIKNGENLIQLKCKDVLIGDLIYDTLIRFKPNTYTINEIKMTHYRLIFRAFLTFYNNQEMLRRYRPKYLVTSHNVYAEFGMLPRQLKKLNNGVVFLKDIYAYKCYGDELDIQEHFLKPSLNQFKENLNSKEFIASSKMYFDARMKGTIDQIDVKNAFLNKKSYRTEDLKEIYPSIDLHKKNVVVMSHAFSDAPHVGEGLLFKDYYDFLEKTLIYLNNNNTVNSFVKAHPSSYMWNEKGAVEELIEKNKLNNIYILPNDFNSSSILDVADSIVTAKGTAGLEFSCSGIPAITAGKGYYYGFGITYEPESIEEYYQLLDKLSSIPKLNEEKINKALVLLYMVATSRRHSKVLPKSHIMPGENYQDVYLDKYAEMIENMKNGVPMKDEFYAEIKADVEKNHV